MNTNDELQIYLEDVESQIQELRHLTTESKVNLAEARRVLHAMEGAAGIMGIQGLRLFIPRLDRMLDVSTNKQECLARCTDFLQHCNEKLQSGSLLGTREELERQFNET